MWGGVQRINPRLRTSAPISTVTSAWSNMANMTVCRTIRSRLWRMIDPCTVQLQSADLHTSHPPHDLRAYILYWYIYKQQLQIISGASLRGYSYTVTGERLSNKRGILCKAAKYQISSHFTTSKCDRGALKQSITKENEEEKKEQPFHEQKETPRPNRQ